MKKDKLIYTKDLPVNEAYLFTINHFALLDIASGLETTGAEEVLRDLLSCLVNDALEPDVKKMKKAHKQQDWEEIQRIAHKIKGAAVYLGTIRLKIACQYLERYWKTGQTELLEQLYQQALDVIQETINAISKWLK